MYSEMKHLCMLDAWIGHHLQYPCLRLLLTRALLCIPPSRQPLCTV